MDSKPLTTDSNSMVIDRNFDKALDSYTNVSNPQLGDAVRYSKENNLASHGSVFLLQNDNGVQVFSKNGLGNNYPFMIVYSQLIEGPNHYGNKEGRVTEKMVEINAKGDKGLKTIKETPFYRK